MEYSVLEANIEREQTKIISILKRNLKGISEQRFIWEYKKNPYDITYCFLIREEDSGEYIGAGALFPRHIYINNTPVICAITGDFAVDKKHRVFGPAVKLQKTIQSSIKEKSLEFLYGIPNKVAEPVFQRIGYLILGNHDRYVKILKTEYRFKKFLPPVFMTKSFSKLIDSIIKLFSKETRYARNKEYFVEINSSFDQRFDTFWSKIIDQFRIIGQRNAKFLNWRYTQFPDKNYEVFMLTDEKKEIAGYLVFYLKENMCHIADFMYSGWEIDTLDCLIGEFCLYMRKRNAGSISVNYFGNKFPVKIFKKYNFFHDKRGHDKIFVYFNDPFALKTVFLDKESWFFTEGDIDV